MASGRLSLELTRVDWLVESCLCTSLKYRRMDLEQSLHQLLPVDRELSPPAAIPLAVRRSWREAGRGIAEATFNLTPVSNTFRARRCYFMSMLQLESSTVITNIFIWGC